jgi:hypothetical protein
MSRSNTRTMLAIIGAVVLASVVALAANAAFGRGATPSPTPNTPPTVAPSRPPSDPPTPTPSPEPSDPPADGPTKVALENLTGDDVSVEIDDQTGGVVRAESGMPGDGMSVRWFDVKVENIDADTLRVVWVGLPRDEVVGLTVSVVDGMTHLAFVQDAPPANSDALGYDRILELTFDQPVRSEDISTSVKERPASQG